MTEAFVAIGSNLQRRRHICQAIDGLSRQFRPLRLSTVYASPANGFNGPEFYNLVAGFSSSWPGLQLLEFLAELQVQCGRPRGGERWASRTLDLDLLSHGDHIGRLGQRHLPDGDILQHSFVLCPLAEIAAGHHHPVLGSSYASLWRRHHLHHLQGSPQDPTLDGAQLRPVAFRYLDRGREQKLPCILS